MTYISKSSWRCLTSLSLVASMFMLGPAAFGQKVLFHGSGTGATGGTDGAVFDFLVEKLGEDNVTYMQGDAAAANGSSADGFDAVIISSTLGSGTVRNKYEDLALPLLNWEQALTRQAAGEFNLSIGGRTNGGSSQIEIVEPDHFITAGLEGTIEVVESAQIFSLGTGDIGAGVQLLANLAGSDNDHAIMVAEQGAELTGDGSDGSPDIAPARRAFLFIEDNTFGALNETGLGIFDRTIDWILLRDLIDFAPGDFNNDGVIDFVDFGILKANFHKSFKIPDSLSMGDVDFNGTVDLRDFVEFRAIFNAPQGGQTVGVPEPSTGVLFLSSLVPFLCRRRRLK
ncbi:MAG: dockerin type I domain-containing protein [Gammaproteobacteria bacterium]|nr:dockerin type I domain-containing protein [Gammaproteobacteria bacterium]